MTLSDNEAPVIACPSTQNIYNTNQSQALTTAVWTDPQVTDNSGRVPTTTCDPESGSQLGIGETEVTCQAVDPAGNQATCMFTVEIEGNGT